MITQAEFINLQRSFYSSGKPPLGKLLSRYEILPRYAILSLSRQIPWRTRLYRMFRNILILLGVAEPVNSNANWSSSLRHVPVSNSSKLVIIWACNYPKDTDYQHAYALLKRRLCQFSSLSHASSFESNSGSDLVSSSYLPVLITNHANFAFYSRLGWLVEYLPNISGLGEAYDDRKAEYLAWRYQNASVLPLSAGLLSDEQWDQFILKEFR